MGTSIGGRWEEVILASGLVLGVYKGRLKKAGGQMATGMFFTSEIMVNFGAYQNVD